MTSLLTYSRWLKWMLLLIGIAALCACAGLLVGAEPLQWADGNLTDTSRTILWQLRLPRVTLGLLVGMALGAGGVSFQALLRNPLADPYILGVSGGAALGSVIGVTLHLPFFGTIALAFAVSISTMLIITWAVARHETTAPHSLLLAGVIFNAFAFAIIMLLHATVSIQEAHAILFLLMGSLESVHFSTVAMVAVCVLPPIIWLTRHGRALNAISLGADTAASLGVSPIKLERRIFVATSIMIGAVVAVSGLIGFVGLFIPHMVRLTLGSDHRLVLPASALVGGGFLVLADTLARTLLASSALQTELPVGVITALIGGPVFVWLLRREMRR